MEQLAVGAWALLVAAALVVGFAKTAAAGAGTIAVAIFAAVLPAREATATLLLLLIVGDVFALASYRRHADWRMLLRLAPMVVGGLALGALFLGVSDDAIARRVIGGILLALVVVSWWSRRHAPGARGRRVQAVGYGLLGGFTTMVANAGGPVMSLYFLALRFDVLTFLGTSAWYFAVVNVLKVPIVAGLGLLDVQALLLVLVLVPGVLVGAVAGRWVAPRLSQEVFARVVTALTILGAVYLIVA